MAEIKRCKTPFAVEDEATGATRVIAAGELVSTDDPAYTDDTAEHFEDIEVHTTEQAKRRARAAGTVEDATADPGEKRTLTRPSRKAADRS